jgi:hypothetical protein
MPYKKSNFGKGYKTGNKNYLTEKSTDTKKKTNLSEKDNELRKKTGKLIFSVVFDLLGMSSYIFWPYSEILDIVFAPMQAAWIYFAYRNKKMAIIGFVEEILPFTDIIPTCTITHFMHYKHLEKDNKKKK